MSEPREESLQTEKSSLRLEELDRQVSQTVEQVVRGLQQEIGERLRRGSQEMLQLVEGLTPELPSSFVPSQDLSTLAAEVGAAASQRAMVELLQAVAKLDKARTQTELLTALLEESCRFASRAAFFLIRPDEIRCWASQGYGRAMSRLEGATFSSEEGAWAAVARAGGPVTLSAAECRSFAADIGAPEATEGLLVPFVLRSHLGGVLLAERLEGEPSISSAGLQLLTYFSSQAIETLAFRSQGASPTLRSDDDEISGLPLWQGAGAAAAVASAVGADVSEGEVSEVAETSASHEGSGIDVLADREVVDSEESAFLEEPIGEALSDDTAKVALVEDSMSEPEIVAEPETSELEPPAASAAATPDEFAEPVLEPPRAIAEEETPVTSSGAESPLAASSEPAPDVFDQASELFGEAQVEESAPPASAAADESEPVADVDIFETSQGVILAPTEEISEEAAVAEDETSAAMWDLEEETSITDSAEPAAAAESFEQDSPPVEESSVDVFPPIEPAAAAPPVLDPTIGQQTVRLDLDAIQNQAPAGVPAIELPPIEPVAGSMETMIAPAAELPTWEVEPQSTVEPSFEIEPEPPASMPFAPATSAFEEPVTAPMAAVTSIDPSEDPTMMTARPEAPAHDFDPAPPSSFAPAPPATPPSSFAPEAVAPVAPEPMGSEVTAAPDPPAPEPPPAASAGGSTQVQPPADITGPGSAFSVSRGPGSAIPEGEEALHEEARRLARLLVSEIKLYNEEIIEVGRRDGNIYERLKDDIDRSRQMYEERIDPRIPDSEDYFYQELVQRLAGGDASVLGI